MLQFFSHKFMNICNVISATESIKTVEKILCKNIRDRFYIF